MMTYWHQLWNEVLQTQESVFFFDSCQTLIAVSYEVRVRH